MTVIEMKSARQRILDAAVEQYYAEGIRAVSADKLIAAAGVSKVTFYRHFPTKNDLIAAYVAVLAQREQDTVAAKRAELADDPAAVLSWYADVMGEASCAPDFRGCPFINAAAELPENDHPGRAVIAGHRSWLTGQIVELLVQLDVTEPALRAHQIMMLRDGAMVSGYLRRAPDQVAAELRLAARAIIGK